MLGCPSILGPIRLVIQQLADRRFDPAPDDAAFHIAGVEKLVIARDGIQDRIIVALDDLVCRGPRCRGRRSSLYLRT